MKKKFMDLIDILVAESRQNDETIDWEEAKKQLLSDKH